MSRLPDSVRDLIDRVVESARLDPAVITEVRRDLEQHFRDGLAAGRSPEDLIRRFGDPDEAAERLARSAGPRSVRSSRVGESLLTSLANDIRLAARSLFRRPALTITAAVVLALGVGANAVVFSVVNELLFRPLPVQDQSSLVDVWPDIPGGNSFLGFSYADFVTFRDQNRVLESLAAFTSSRFELGEPGRGEPVVGQIVSPEYFDMLGLSAGLGRLIAPGAAFGEPPEVVLSHDFWQASFGGDVDVLGRSVRLDGHAATIIGVGPPGFSGHFIGFPTDLWLPITAAVPLIDGFDPADRSQMPFEMIGRAGDGVSAQVVQAVLNSIASEIERSHPEIKRGHRVGVTPTTGVDHSLRGGVTVFAGILAVVSALVLLIACLNVGSLLLVRAMSRDREMAVRLAIGAGPLRLIRHLLAETGLLVALGAVLGIAAAARLNGLLADLVRSLSGGLGLDLPLDWRVLGLTAGAALLAAVLASVAPGLHMLRRQPSAVLRARQGGTLVGNRLRTALVVGQVAVSVVLVVATGLFVRALVEGARANPGFDADRVAGFGLTVAPAMGNAEGALTVPRQILEALASIPGVEGVTLSDGPLPGVARSPTPMDIPGVQPPPGQDRLIVDGRTVGADFLAVMGIGLVSGRDFTAADQEHGPPVAVVSEAFARRFWPGEDPLERSLVAGGQGVRVVGVARDARYLVQDDTPDPLIYVSLAGRLPTRAQIALRSQRPAALTRAVNEAIRGAIPGHPNVQLRTARQALSDALFPQRMGSLIVGAMGLAALLLATVGLYGLLHFMVARDTHELGVRLALGGSRLDLLKVVIRRGFVLVAAGTAVGIGVALLAAPGLRSFLGGVSPADPLTYGVVMLSFAGVAIVSTWLPARRAARIDPAEALRGE